MTRLCSFYPWKYISRFLLHDHRQKNKVTMRREHGLPLLLMQCYPFLLLLLLPLLPEVRCLHTSEGEFSRDDFPPEFVFGAGTSAYQYEGAVAEDGRSPGIWDTFTHQGKTFDKSTGDVASDGYHKYKEDVKYMSDTGIEAYRFSISWSRLIPNGRGAVNPKGLKYYNDLVDELIKHGIQPHVTLYQLDLPQVLEDEYEGWLSPKIQADFTAYADVCFKEFGDRVSHWTTMDEPNIISIAYDNGVFAPNRCSRPFGFVNCSRGNSTTEPYIVMHNLLLAHASVSELYNTKYKSTQKGMVGLNVYTFWFAQVRDTPRDEEATQRAKDFYMGWLLDPLVYGDYPAILKEVVGHRLPSFTREQSRLVKGSFDFIGVNHYMTMYVSDALQPRPDLRDFFGDAGIRYAVTKNDTPTPQFAPGNAPPDASGLEKVLLYLKTRYGNPLIYIQENGLGLSSDSLDDSARLDAIKGYIGAVLAAIRKGADVKGYFVWSFLDVFEFLSGYQSRFGLYYVDFEDEDKSRKPRKSALWYKGFLKKTIGAKMEAKVGLGGSLHASN